MAAQGQRSPDTGPGDQRAQRQGWLDCSSGVSGDMLLGALVAAGVPLDHLQAAVDAVTPEPVRLKAEAVRRAGVAATLVAVQHSPSPTTRTWADIQRVLGRTGVLAETVRTRALATFERLAMAESRIHGVPPSEVHFHEVGALDAIADIVAVCAGFEALGLANLTASPVAVGSGMVRTSHGTLPVPAPAVVELLAGVPTYGGRADIELATPTGAALLVEHVEAWGSQPSMAVERQAIGAGTRERADQPNVVRLLIGPPVELAQRTHPTSRVPGTVASLILEANVDDLDPRLWPAVLTRLLEAGAADAWLVPILMKKGRPAHTLRALVDQERAAEVRAAVFRETSTIGLREFAVAKHPLSRDTRVVEVAGQPIRIKVASFDGLIANVQPEYDDLAVAANALGRPLKAVLADSVMLAQTMGLTPGTPWPPAQPG